MQRLWKFEVAMKYGLCVGLFKATDEEVKEAIGCRIFISEGAGKYDDIIGTLSEDDITLVSADPHVVESVPEIGYNPLEYLSLDYLD